MGPGHRDMIGAHSFAPPQCERAQRYRVYTGLMPLYGIDGASYQAGFNFAQAKAEGFSFALWKATQGGDYENPTFASDYRRGVAAGIRMLPYHFIGNSSVPEQVSNFIQAAGPVVSSKTLAIDHERDTQTSGPPHGMNKAIVDEFTRRGWKVVLNYYPRWYWQEVGGGPIANGPLWSSNYVLGSGYASVLAQKITPNQWASYGGQPVAMLQYSDSVLVAGQKVDGNFYPGTLEQLTRLFTGGAATTVAATVPVKGPDEVDDATINKIAAKVVSTLLATRIGGLGDSKNFTDHTTRTWVFSELMQGLADIMPGTAGKHYDGRSAAIMRSANAQAAAANHKLDELTQKIGTPSADVDIPALAAALAPLLASHDAQVIATTVADTIVQRMSTK